VTAAPRVTRARGRASEDLAASFLEARGLVVCASQRHARRRRARPRGPLSGDAGAPDTIVFVEVRSRADDRAGHPLETIGPAKQRRLVRAATAWLLARIAVGARRGALRRRGDRVRRTTKPRRSPGSPGPSKSTAEPLPGAHMWWRRCGGAVAMARSCTGGSPTISHTGSPFSGPCRSPRTPS
jgi:Holliday junction resolvase-like predicted endonuclease